MRYLILAFVVGLAAPATAQRSEAQVFFERVTSPPPFNDRAKLDSMRKGRDERMRRDMKRAGGLFCLNAYDPFAEFFVLDAAGEKAEMSTHPALAEVPWTSQCSIRFMVEWTGEIRSAELSQCMGGSIPLTVLRSVVEDARAEWRSFYDDDFPKVQYSWIVGGLGAPDSE